MAARGTGGEYVVDLYTPLLPAAALAPGIDGRIQKNCATV